jgi:endonuclease/exonuclease/phosphatase family metal-dependent hydrolase
MKKGEAMPVFYRADRYNLLEFDHFWLSGQPHIPGLLGWDAACPRMVTWVCLQDKSSGDTLFVFNSHFDHMGIKAREMSATRIVEAADSLAGKYPAIITGDFNSTPKDPAYLITVKAGFTDSRMASATTPVGPEYTFTGFDISKTPGDRIDYIFIRNIKKVNSYLVRTDHSNDMYYSDHLPVVVKVSF